MRLITYDRRRDASTMYFFTMLYVVFFIILKEKYIRNQFGQLVSQISPKMWCNSDILYNKILFDNPIIANIFNYYFQSITKGLGLFKLPVEPLHAIFHSIGIIIHKILSHTSISKSKQNFLL